MNLGTLRVPEDSPEKGAAVTGFDRQNILRHVGILGSSGSGKTVMAKAILEECAIAGTPSIIIDVQGDLARLAMPPEGDERSDPDRQSEWTKAADVRVWTPLSNDGLPLCLDPFDPPSSDIDSELLGAWDRLAAGLTSLLGHDLSKPKGKQAKAFLYNHMTSLAESGEAPYDFGELAESIRAVDPKEVEDVITGAALKELGRNAEANNSGADALLYTMGTPLDIGTMMQRREDGRTPVNVLYLNTLTNDEMKQAFIQQLCRKLYDWMLANPSPDSLQCVLFVDEAGPFMPPDPRSPPAKEGLRLLLKQGRKYGVGCLVASQSPGDLDYRTLGQASTMFLGRFTQKQEISKIDQMVSNAPDPKAITASLPSLKAGEFELFSPDVSDEVVQMRVRWLLTPHGSPLTSEAIRPLTPEPLRKWAAGFVRRTPKRSRVPSWRRGEAAAPPELMHGIPTLRSADDPMQVMLTTTNALAFATLLLTTFFLGQSYIDGELNAAWLAVGGLISVILSVLLAMDWLLQGEGELAARVRERARGFEWVVLAWIWAMWGIDQLGWLDLGWAYYPVMASQTLLTVFVALEYAHSLRLAGTILGGESLLDRVRSVGAALTEAERERARSSSEDLMRRFGMLTTTLTVALLATLLWTGGDLGSGLLSEAAVRVVTLEGSVLVASVASLWSRGG